MSDERKLCNASCSFMVESYLEDGCQSIGGGVYGKSITDPCIGWPETERLVKEIAGMV